MHPDIATASQSSPYYRHHSVLRFTQELRICCLHVPSAMRRRRRGNGCTARATDPASVEPPRESEYNDTWSDVAFIALCRKAYGNIAGWQSPRGWTDGKETYAGMVEVSRALMKGRTAAQQREAVIAGFPEVPPWFRRAFPYSKWGAELNARITPAFFTWLVGPMKTVEVEVNGQSQTSGVHIEKCRYLAESGCVGMCVNLCKSPVQTFFTEQLGMPLTMSPNFEGLVRKADMSCEMVFGQAPPPLEEDDVMKAACLTACPTAVSGPRCAKLL